MDLNDIWVLQASDRLSLGTAAGFLLEANAPPRIILSATVRLERRFAWPVDNPYLSVAQKVQNLVTGNRAAPPIGSDRGSPGQLNPGQPILEPQDYFVGCPNSSSRVSGLAPA